MAENAEMPETTAQAKSLPLLPRSAWNSQLTYLKVLLQAKQTLDQSSSFRQR